MNSMLEPRTVATNTHRPGDKLSIDCFPDLIEASAQGMGPVFIRLAYCNLSTWCLHSTDQLHEVFNFLCNLRSLGSKILLKTDSAKERDYETGQGFVTVAIFAPRS